MAKKNICKNHEWLIDSVLDETEEYLEYERYCIHCGNSELQRVYSTKNRNEVVDKYKKQ